HKIWAMGAWPPGRSPWARSWRAVYRCFGAQWVGVGGDAVAASVGVVELDVHAPGPGSVQGGDAPARGQGAARLHGVRVLSVMAAQAGAGLSGQARTGPVPYPERDAECARLDDRSRCA